MSQEILDSRILQEEINKLEEKQKKELENLDLEDIERLKNLLKLKQNFDKETWDFGITFVASWYFEDYIRDYAYGCGIVDKNSIINNYIDWDAFVKDVKQDYCSINIDNEMYFYQEV